MGVQFSICIIVQLVLSRSSLRVTWRKFQHWEVYKTSTLALYWKIEQPSQIVMGSSQTPNPFPVQTSLVYHLDNSTSDSLSAMIKSYQVFCDHPNQRVSSVKDAESLFNTKGYSNKWQVLRPLGWQEPQTQPSCQTLCYHVSRFRGSSVEPLAAPFWVLCKDLEILPKTLPPPPPLPTTIIILVVILVVIIIIIIIKKIIITTISMQGACFFFKGWLKGEFLAPRHSLVLAQGLWFYWPRGAARLMECCGKRKLRQQWIWNFSDVHFF